MMSEFLRRYRVNLHFVSRGRIDYDSPEGEFIMLMEAVGNQYWGTKAKEVMKNGRRAMIQDGIKPGQGPTLYGYVKSGDRRETRYDIAEPAAEIIRRIFTEVAAGKGIVAIGRDLTAEGIPTPSQAAQMQKVKRKDYGIWTPKILHRILKNEAYTGTLWLNRTSGPWRTHLCHTGWWRVPANIPDGRSGAVCPLRHQRTPRTQYGDPDDAKI
jgi:DNA invertase Pin-like site-specific DNA recombinase